MADTNFDSVVANTFTGTFVGPVGGAVSATTIAASGQVTVAAGTAGAPAYSFTGDTNTGIYHPGADQLKIAAGGLDIVSIDTVGLQAVIGNSAPAAATVTALTANTSATVGGGTAITQIKVYSQTVTPAAVTAATAAEQTFTVTGVTTADKVIVNPAATGNATAVGAARVSAANTVAITFINPTAGNLTPGAGTYTFVTIRS